VRHLQYRQNLRYGVARTKGEIISSLSQTGVAVLNLDDAFFHYWRRLAGDRRVVSFGLTETADIYAKDISSSLTNRGFTTSFTLQADSESLGIKLGLAGVHNVRNALAAAAASLQLGFTLAEIKQGLENVKPVTGRMQPVLGRKGNTVIDDTYNANPASLQAALSALNPQENNWLILGAFAELGPDSIAIHSEMGNLIKSMPVSRLFATGELTKSTVAAFGDGAAFFENQQQLIQALNQELTGSETLLIKGSRSQKMENVVAALVDNFRAA
jgi:UDP-N-acetylmuramoyl-tripeptide--D-alanyl-D-alanine ligase